MVLSLIVMKFGGSSVGDAERMKRVAKRVTERSLEGHRCVVVVSAMGDTTDDLVDLSKQIYDGTPPAREMDSCFPQVNKFRLRCCPWRYII